MINLLSFLENKEDLQIKGQIREIYNRINIETPRNMDDLEKKYEFKFLPVHNNAGSSSQFYELENNLGGKVLYGRRNDGYHGLVLPSRAFKYLRNEYINHKIGLELGFPLPKELDFVLAKETKNKHYIPMIINENLGNEEVGNFSMSSEEKKISIEKFKLEVIKLKQYLSNIGTIDLNNLNPKRYTYEWLSNRVRGADVCHVNSRWNSEKQKAYFIDVEDWKFNGLKY